MHKRIQSQWHKMAKVRQYLLNVREKNNLSYFAYYLHNIINFTPWCHIQKVYKISQEKHSVTKQQQENVNKSGVTLIFYLICW